MAVSLRYESSFVLLDFRESHAIPPTSLLLARMRRRIYGILLRERPGSEEAPVVTEWCFAGHGSLEEPTEQPPEPPPRELTHVGLAALRDPRERGSPWVE